MLNKWVSQRKSRKLSTSTLVPKKTRPPSTIWVRWRLNWPSWEQWQLKAKRKLVATKARASKCKSTVTVELPWLGSHQSANLRSWILLLSKSQRLLLMNSQHWLAYLASCSSTMLSYNFSIYQELLRAQVLAEVGVVKSSRSESHLTLSLWFWTHKKVKSKS